MYIILALEILKYSVADILTLKRRRYDVGISTKIFFLSEHTCCYLVVFWLDLITLRT